MLHLVLLKQVAWHRWHVETLILAAMFQQNILKLLNVWHHKSQEIVLNTGCIIKEGISKSQGLVLGIPATTSQDFVNFSSYQDYKDYHTTFARKCSSIYKRFHHCNNTSDKHYSVKVYMFLRKVVKEQFLVNLWKFLDLPLPPPSACGPRRTDNQ